MDILVEKSESDENASTTLAIEKGSGLKISVGQQRAGFLRLENGTAEVLGAEMELNKPYELPIGAEFTIATWHGCVLNIAGCSFSRLRTWTSGHFLSIHGGLNDLRSFALSKNRRGPRVLVAGPTDVGKSSFCKILMNYAVRSGWSPMFVDLDVGQNEISIPGTISALCLTEQTGILRGFPRETFKTSHFGHKSPSENFGHYEHLIDKMAESINKFQKDNPSLGFGGVIINTCGWVTGQGYSSILRASSSFEVDMVVVIGDELLCLSLTSDLPEFVRVLALPRPAEVVARSTNMRRSKRNSTIRDHFFGVERNLCPQELTVAFEDVDIFKIGRCVAADPTEMPSDATRCKGRPQVTPVDIGPELKGHVASMIAVNIDDDEVLHAAVAGFVIILKVDMDGRHLTILAENSRGSEKLGALMLMDGVVYDGRR